MSSEVLVDPANEQLRMLASVAFVPLEDLEIIEEIEGTLEIKRKGLRR